MLTLDTWIQICLYLKFTDIVHLYSCNKQLAKLCKSEKLWNLYFKHNYEYNDFDSTKSSYLNVKILVLLEMLVQNNNFFKDKTVGRRVPNKALTIPIWGYKAFEKEYSFKILPNCIMNELKKIVDYKDCYEISNNECWSSKAVEFANSLLQKKLLPVIPRKGDYLMFIELSKNGNPGVGMYYDGKNLVNYIDVAYDSMPPNIGLAWPEVDAYYWGNRERKFLFGIAVLPYECIRQFYINETFGEPPLKLIKINKREYYKKKNITTRHYSWATINGHTIYCFMNSCYEEEFCSKSFYKSIEIAIAEIQPPIISLSRIDEFFKNEEPIDYNDRAAYLHCSHRVVYLHCSPEELYCPEYEGDYVVLCDFL